MGVLGTGGASKAVKQALKDLGVAYLSVSRIKDEHQLSYQELRENAEFLKNYPLLINTTPLGTFPKVDGIPDIPLDQLTSAHLVYDLVYNPAVTKYLEKGAAQGATTQNGLEMLHLQADASWEIWNSETPFIQ